MSPDTTKRIISALILLAIVGICLFTGTTQSILLVFVFGILILDEFYCNFFKFPRFTPQYFLTQVLLVIPFLLFNFWASHVIVWDVVSGLAAAVNIGLLFYLFYVDLDNNVLKKFFEKYPYLIGIFFLLPLSSLTAIFHFEKWRAFLGLLLIVNYGMDTGAWFFGKKFGKRKLWPKVSPKKTIEGLIGGMLTSGFLGGIFWHIAFGKIEFTQVLIFCLLGAMSQLGDLIQSKMKRQFEIKDSSKLIPGHGGVYDRLDSLLYLGPFFVTAIRSFYLK
jgi:phosphatidate cytidylyltransferase